MDECINKIWYIHTIEYYLALNRKKILIHATIWMNVKDIVLSEMSHSQKDRYFMIPYIFHLYEVSRVVKFIETKNGGCQGLGEEGMRSCGLMDTEFQFGKKKNSGDGWW